MKRRRPNQTTTLLRRSYIEPRNCMAARLPITVHHAVSPPAQWRSNGVGKMGKVQGAPSAGAPSYRPKKLN